MGRRDGPARRGSRRSGPRSPVAFLALLVLLTGVCRSVSGQDAPDEPWRIASESSYTVRGPGGNRVIGFERNVVILHGALVINSDRAEYLDDVHRAVLSGHVVMTQDSTVARGPSAIYDRDARVARFANGVLIERPTGTAVADAGWWFRDDNRFELRGHAAAADTSGTLDADAMTYDTARETFHARGNARMVDDVSGLVVLGQELRYERSTSLATATGDPVAIFTDDDSVEVRTAGDLITFDPVANVAVAQGNVRVERETMVATAGIVRMERASNRVIFREDPVIIDGLTEIRGDRVEMETSEGGRRIVRVKGAARVSNRFLSSRDRPMAPEDAGPVPAPDDGPVPDDAPVPSQDDAAESPDADAPAAEGAPSAADVPTPEDAPAPEIAPIQLPPGLRGGPGDVRGKTRRDLEQRAGELAARVDSATVLEALEEGAPESVRDDVEAAVTEALAVADSAAAAGDSAEVDPTPEWLRIPGEDLPTENLLFGEEVTIFFQDNELVRVDVVGYGRSKFFPNESRGELTEWNDVVGDTLHVWFTESEVDSVMVLGHGVGEYRLAAGEDAMASPEQLKERGKLVEYEAPVIRYDRASEMMHLEGGSQVRYKTMQLRSGTIDFDAPNEVMVAGGDPSPVLVDVGDEIKGSQMRYHLGTEKGEILEGFTRFEDAFYRGDDIWKLGDNVLAVENAEFTTCDRDDPHYHFASKHMKIYLDDKVVAKPIVLRIREIPVFALPFYMASLKKGRHSGFLLPNLELGVDDNRGRFIRNLGYYWAPNDYMDGTLTFDFYPSQDRIVSYLNTRYNVRYRYSGRAAIKYNRDVPRNQKDTAIELSHQQTLSETMTLTGDARFVSSQDIYRDIDDEQRLDRDLRSHLTLNKRWTGSNRSLRVEVERRENLDTGEVDETLPTIQFSQPSRPVMSGEGRSVPGEEPSRNPLRQVYYSLDSRFVSERSKDLVTTVVNDTTRMTSFQEDRNTGSQVRSSLRTTASLGPYLRISPSANGEATWINEDALGDANATRATYSTALTASTNLYGTLLRPIGPTRGIRHVIEPSMSWSWAPEFREYFYVDPADTNGTERDRFTSFGGIGSTQRETNSMSFSLRNLVQTKVEYGGQVHRWDLFTLRNSISYDLLAEDRSQRPLSSLSSSLTILSALPVNQSWTVSHDPYSWGLQRTSVTTRARLNSSMLSFGGSSEPAAGADSLGEGDPAEDPSEVNPVGGGRENPFSGGGTSAGRWSADISHTAQRGSGGDLSSSLVLNSTWSPTRKWQVSYATQYDLKTGENTSQNWSIHRTVHCWEIAFDRRLLGGEWQYYFRVNVTDLPDIQAERGDSFRGRQSVGSSLDSLF